MMRHVLVLALVRLWRSRASVCCQVLALFAMMTPLLIILGLKYGIVESMKERLLRDPSALEIRMTDAVEVTDELLAGIRSWPETGFAVPCVGAIYSNVSVCAPGGRESDELRAEMIPTAPGDPLLHNTRLPLPAEGEVVLSEALAQKLQAQVGEQVCLRVRRSMRQELLERSFSVVGILPKHHLLAPAVLLPLETTVEVENFVVAGRGVPGSSARVSGALYDAVVLAQGATEKTAVLMATQMPQLHAGVSDGSAYPGVPNGHRLVLGRGTRLTPEQVDTLVAQAEVQHTPAWPWVEPQQAELRVAEQRRGVRVVGVSGGVGSAGSCEAPPQLMLPVGSAGAEYAELVVPSPHGESCIVCRAVEDAAVPEGEAWATPQVLALLREGRERCLVWDCRVDSLRYPVLNFQSLRVYASSMACAEPLMNRLQAAGVSCRARLGIIRQIFALEHSLSTLFLVITAGTGVGAVVSFALSLFNAAELHRRDYALVQLLGSGRAMLALMPLVDALATTVLALLLTFAAFYATSSVISLIFTESAGSGALCRLAPYHIVGFCLAGLVVACIASLAAALKVLRISPAEILRQS